MQCIVFGKQRLLSLATVLAFKHNTRIDIRSKVITFSKVASFQVSDKPCRLTFSKKLAQTSFTGLLRTNCSMIWADSN